MLALKRSLPGPMSEMEDKKKSQYGSYSHKTSKLTLDDSHLSWLTRTEHKLYLGFKMHLAQNKYCELCHPSLNAQYVV